MKKATLPAGVVGATRDRVGRVVLLEEDAVAHIEKRHPEMYGRELAIATALEVGVRCRTHKDGREKWFAPELGPGKYLAVVVAYENNVGKVITAFADKNGPRKADRI
jgi:hypothetical protein